MQHAKLTAIELARLEACSSEPIRTPGSIQPHGALFAVERDSHIVVVVSENIEHFIGVEPSAVLGHLIDEFVGEDNHPALTAAAQGSHPVPLTFSDREFDAIVHREGPVSFIELEPRLDPELHEPPSATYAAAQRLAAFRDRESLLRETALEFSRLAGFDRTMVYDFHRDGHGEVVAEVCAEGMEPYLGLHFPASDIPAQARALYLTKLSRAIVSTAALTVPLVGLTEVGGVTLDLSSAELRSVSPFHLQFMRNMGQASTVSFSLIHEGVLIGMITCANNAASPSFCGAASRCSPLRLLFNSAQPVRSLS